MREHAQYANVDIDGLACLNIRIFVRDVISTTDSIQGEDKRKCFDVLRLALDLEAEYVDVELEVINYIILRSTQGATPRVFTVDHR